MNDTTTKRTTVRVEKGRVYRILTNRFSGRYIRCVDDREYFIDDVRVANSEVTFDYHVIQDGVILREHGSYTYGPDDMDAYTGIEWVVEVHPSETKVKNLVTCSHCGATRYT